MEDKRDKRAEITLEDVLEKLTGRRELPSAVAMNGLWNKISNEKLNSQEFGILLDAAAEARDRSVEKSEDYKVLRDLIASVSTRIAVKAAQKYEKDGMRLEDAFQAARIGVLDGITKWDPSIHAVAPVAYLSTCAKHSISNSWRREYRLSGTASVQITQIRRLQRESALEGREPEMEELVKKTGLSKEVIKNRLLAIGVMQKESLDDEAVSKLQYASVKKLDEGLMLRALVELCKERLSPNEWEILSACIGITADGEEVAPAQQKDLAAVRGTSAQAVNKSYVSAIKKLSNDPDVREWAGKSPLPKAKKSTKAAQKSKSKSRNEDYER